MLAIKRHRCNDNLLHVHKRIKLVIEKGKRRRETIKNIDIVKRLRNTIIEESENDTPHLVITDIPDITRLSRSHECSYYTFNMWDIDIRVWAATDIQRIYRGWLVRKRAIKRS
jgi:hypothetical protein